MEGHRCWKKKHVLSFDTLGNKSLAFVKSVNEEVAGQTRDTRIACVNRQSKTVSKAISTYS